MQRLCCGFPPHDVRLDAVQFFEGTIDAFRGAQHCVHVGKFDPVSNQRELKCVFRAFAQAAFTRDFFQVKEVGPRGWLGLELVTVPRQAGIPDDVADTAVAHGFRNKISFIADFGPFNFFIEPGLAAQHKVFTFYFNHVPVRVAGFNFGVEHAHSAIPALVEYFFAGLFGERCKKQLALCVLKVASPGDNR